MAYCRLLAAVTGLGAAKLLLVAPVTHSFIFHRAFQRLTRPTPSTHYSVLKQTHAEEEIVWDEDDVDMESFLTYDEYRQEFEQLAKRTSRDPSAVDDASDLFDNMYQAYLTLEDASLWPNTDIYNLLLETHAYSRDEQGAEVAEQILNRMIAGNHGAAKPNVDSFAVVMEAWIRRRRVDKVEQLYQSLDEDLRSEIALYNKLVKAYGYVGNAEKAEALLEGLLAHDDQDPLQPNYKTWVHVLRAYAGAQYAGPGLEKIQSMLRRMARGYRDGHDDWKPGTAAHNALLRAMSHVSGSAREAESMLFEMIGLARDGEEDMQPDAETFYNVMLAYREETDASVPFKLQRLIELQDALHKETGAADLAPSFRTFKTAMSLMCKTRDTKKALRCQKLMNRIRESYNSGDDFFAPDLPVYKHLLKSCAYTVVSEPKDKLAVFQIAVDAFKEAKASGLALDGTVFSLFLRACAQLMPANRKRDAVVENVFTACCNAGCLNDYVLRAFKSAGSDELQLRLVGGFLEDGVRPPDEWRRNA